MKVVDIKSPNLIEKLYVWEEYYNKERSHSALQRKTPCEQYKELESQIPTVEEVYLNYHLARENFIPIIKNGQNGKSGFVAIKSIEC